MSAATPTVLNNIKPGDGSVISVAWDLTTADPTGAWFENPQYSDRCVQAVATNAGGSTVTIEGSNDGATEFPLTNAAGGTAATFTASGGKQILENPRFIRAKITTGGTLAVWTITLVSIRKK